MVVARVGNWFWPVLFGSNIQYEGIAWTRSCVANCLESHCNCIGHVADCLVEWCFIANRRNVDFACRNWNVSDGFALSSFCERTANDAKPSRVPHNVARTGAAARLGSLYTLRGSNLSTATLVDLGRSRIHFDWPIVSLCLACARSNGGKRIINASDAYDNTNDRWRCSGEHAL